MDRSLPPAIDGVLILGAGWLGGALASALAHDGVRVTTVRRTPHDAPAGGHAVAFDLSALGAPDGDDTTVPEAFAHHALVVAMVAPDRTRGDDHAHTYPAGARAAVRIARAIGARALCWISSTGVYGYADGREVTEQSDRAADSPSQRALCEAEDLVLAAEHDALRVGVLRASGLYGPDRDPAGRYRDAASLAGRTDHWVNLAWRDDVIGAIRCWSSHALGDGPVPPRVLNVSDGTPLTVAECARLVARADGRTLDLPVTALGASTSPMRSNQRIRVDALRALGWVPTVPHLRVGLERLGYRRLAAEHQPYGPNTAPVRGFLRALSALDQGAHDRIVDAWRAHAETPAFRRAERLLGELMAKTGREAERDAAAGPLLQMVRLPDDPGAIDPIAEPALATLMALVIRDVLPPDDFDALTAPMDALLARD
jgi:nucleoside-diphosphate-sugar epimerase